MSFKRVEVRKKKPGPGWWSEKTRMEVVTAYVLLGKVSLVVASTGVPEDTVRKWKMAPWWKEAEDEIRRSSKLALSGKLQDVVARTFIALEDRVANGDYIYDSKLQTFVRKPINALAANKIINDMLDKSILLEEKATREVVNQDGIQQRLDKIREELRSFAKGRKPNEEDVIDVSPVERVVEDNRQYGDYSPVTRVLTSFGDDLHTGSTVGGPDGSDLGTSTDGSDEPVPVEARGESYSNGSP
jgi:hypothetical protein